MGQPAPGSFAAVVTSFSVDEFESPHFSRLIRPCPNNHSMLVYSGSGGIGRVRVTQGGETVVPEDKAAIVKGGWQNKCADDGVAIINAVGNRAHGSWVVDGLKGATPQHKTVLNIVRIGICARNHALVSNSEELSRDGVGEIDRLEMPVVEFVPLEDAAVGTIEADDLAAVIDVARIGIRSAGIIEDPEMSMLVSKAVNVDSIIVIPEHITPAVDSAKQRIWRVGKIDGRKAAVAEQETLKSQSCAEIEANDRAARIDSERPGKG